MKQAVDCIPCYIKQVISAMRIAGIEEEKHDGVVRGLFPVLGELDPSRSPAENSSLVLFEAHRLMGCEDPFKEAKSASNKLARTFIPALEKALAASDDPLLTALKASVAGNAIDMGINPDFDVDESLSRELKREFRIDDSDTFRRLLNKDGSLVVIGDNSGEIVFDYLLMTYLHEFTGELVYVVKGGPILNDATHEDAEEAGIHQLARVITTGNNYLGVIPELGSPELQSAIASADAVLSKGQANYETLEGTDFAGDKTFFLLQAKCPVIAAHLGAGLGDSVMVRNKPE
ncbi:MAG: ARMT1-like domain-containing protein [Dethiobacteria bacterium]